MKGFTLVEIVISIGIVGLILLIAAFSILNLQDLGELSREKVAAVTDAVCVLEAMREAANQSPANLQSTNWSVWANTNIIGVKGTNETQLDQENVMVTFPGGAANPVQFSLSVNWRHKQRPYSYPIATRMTDRDG